MLSMFLLLLLRMHRVRLRCLDSMTVRITEAVRVSMVGIDGGLSSSSKTGINLHIPRGRSSIIIAVGNLDASTHKEECG
jgi:hypothetical protein